MPAYAHSGHLDLLGEFNVQMHSTCRRCGNGASLTATGAADDLDGEAIAQKTGCLGCNSVDTRIIGTAYRDVAAKYRGRPFAEWTIRWKVRHGTGKNRPVPMPAFDEKTLSDVDLERIAKSIRARRTWRCRWRR